MRGAIIESMELAVTSPQQEIVEPVSVSEMAFYLRVPIVLPPDDQEQVLIGSLISSAREISEILQNRDLVVKRWVMTLNRFPQGPIELRAPLITVHELRYLTRTGETLVLSEGTDYAVYCHSEPGLVIPLSSWPGLPPHEIECVQCEFTSGYQPDHPYWLDAGTRIITGIKLLVSHWYDNRLPFFAIGGSAIQELPMTVTALLSAGAAPRILR